MKAESTIRPNMYNVDKVGDLAIISLFNNIRETENQEGEIVFEYDYYSLEVLYREGLESDIEYNYDKWLDLAQKNGSIHVINLEERLQMVEDTLLYLLMGGI